MINIASNLNRRCVIRLLVALLIIVVSAVTADAPELLFTPAPTETAEDKPAIYPTPSAIALAGLESKIPDETAAKEMEKTFNRFKRKYGNIAREAEVKERLQRAIVPAVAVVESSGIECDESSAGAIGIMQLMPIHFSPKEKKRACDPKLNIPRGAKVLREMIDKGEGDKTAALSFYAGSHTPIKRAMKLATTDNVPIFATLPTDRQEYVEKVEGVRFAYLFWKLTGRVPSAQDFTECRA